MLTAILVILVLFWLGFWLSHGWDEWILEYILSEIKESNERLRKLEMNLNVALTELNKRNSRTGKTD